MRIAIDFDGCIVVNDRPYDDVATPLTFVPGARDALFSLKAANHKLLLWSGRASPALLVDPGLDPFARARGLTSGELDAWAARRHIHVARHEQMLRFVEDNLPGVFDAVDDGRGGKPSVDLFIDDRALRPTVNTVGIFGGLSWNEIAQFFGHSPIEAAHAAG